REAHERVVDRGVSMRVVVTHHLADDACALPRRAIRLQPGLVHRIQHAPVNRLETVTDVRQRATDDHAHRVIEEAAPYFLLELARLDATRAERFSCQLTHSSTPSSEAMI